PLPRAEISQVLAVAAIQHGRPTDAGPALIEAARRVAPFDSGKALELLLYALMAGSDAGDLALHEEIAERGRAIAAGDESDWSRIAVRLVVGCAAIAGGDDEHGVPLVEEAFTWAADTEDERVAFWGAACGFWTGDDEGILALATRAVALARRRGAITIL